MEIVILAVPAITPTSSSSWFHLFLYQFLHVVYLNIERYAIVVQEGGEGYKIVIGNFDVNRLEKMAWLFPEINL